MVWDAGAATQRFLFFLKGPFSLRLSGVLRFMGATG